MERLPTAKELMDRGIWELRATHKEGLGKLHYYLERRENGTYRVMTMEGASLLGKIVWGTVMIFAKVARVLLNAIRKGTGDEFTKDLIEEVSEYIAASNHRLSSGKSYSLTRGQGTTLEECDLIIAKDINNYEEKAGKNNAK